MFCWPERRRLALVLLVACLLYAGSAGFFDLITSSYGSDVGHYVITAQSLAEGRGYRNVNDPAQPTTSLFPPLLPMLLSPIVALFPHSMPALRFFAILPSLGAVYAVHLYLRRAAPRWALGVTALFAWSIFVVGVAAIPQSEMLFTLLLFLVLLASETSVRGARTRASTLPVLLVLMTLAFYTRLIGVVLVAAVPLYLWLRGQRRNAVIVAGSAALAALPWFVYVYRDTGTLIGPSYGNDFFGAAQPVLGPAAMARLAGSAVRNSVWLATEGLPDTVTGLYMGQVQNALSALGLAWLLRVAGLAITALMLLGFWLHQRRGVTAAACFIVIYGAVLLVDSAQVPRYLLPLLPLLYLYFFTGLRWLGECLRAPWAVRLAGVAILLVMVVRVASFYEKGASWLHARQGKDDWIAWLAANIEASDVIFSDSPRIIAFETARYSLGYPAWTCASGSDLGWLRRGETTYVALHPRFGATTREQRCMRDVITGNPGQFTEVLRDDSLSVVVYRVTQQ